MAALVQRSRLDEPAWSAAGATVAWAQQDERMLVFTMADEVAKRMRAAADAPTHVAAQLLDPSGCSQLRRAEVDA